MGSPDDPCGPDDGDEAQPPATPAPIAVVVDPAAVIHDPVEDVMGFNADVVKRANFTRFLEITNDPTTRAFVADIEAQCGAGASTKIAGLLDFFADVTTAAFPTQFRQFIFPLAMGRLEIVAYLNRRDFKNVLIARLKRIMRFIPPLPTL